MTEPTRLMPGVSAAGSELTQDRDHAGPVVMVLLYDGHAVRQTLFDGVRLHVEEALPRLKPGARYTAKMLCGDEFWGRLTRGECSMAGRCLAHMVMKGLLPLRFVDSRSCSKHYQLK
jgi:hypothetical protein